MQSDCISDVLKEIKGIISVHNLREKTIKYRQYEFSCNK